MKFISITVLLFIASFCFGQNNVVSLSIGPSQYLQPSSNINWRLPYNEELVNGFNIDVNYKRQHNILYVELSSSFYQHTLDLQDIDAQLVERYDSYLQRPGNFEGIGIEEIQLDGKKTMRIGLNAGVGKSLRLGSVNLSIGANGGLLYHKSPERIDTYFLNRPDYTFSQSHFWTWNAVGYAEIGLDLSEKISCFAKPSYFITAIRNNYDGDKDYFYAQISSKSLNHTIQLNIGVGYTF